MKAMIKATVASALLAGAGWAAAAEPVALSDSQMDSVAAGSYMHSGSGGSAFAIGGLAGSGTTTSATQVGWFYARTSSSTVSLAVGVVAGARSGGGSSIGGGLPG